MVCAGLLAATPGTDVLQTSLECGVDRSVRASVSTRIRGPHHRTRPRPPALPVKPVSFPCSLCRELWASDSGWGLWEGRGLCKEVLTLQKGLETEVSQERKLKDACVSARGGRRGCASRRGWGVRGGGPWKLETLGLVRGLSFLCCVALDKSLDFSVLPCFSPLKWKRWGFLPPGPQQSQKGMDGVSLHSGL